MRVLHSKFVLSLLCLLLSMTSFELMGRYPLVGIFIPFTTYLLGILFGVSQGRQKEKNRAVSLCLQCLHQVMSGSVRRVLNGIAEDRTKLLSEDEFFGPQSGVPSMQASNGAQERPSPNP